MKFVIILVREKAEHKIISREEVEKFLKHYQQLPSWCAAYTNFQAYTWEPGNAMQLPNGWLFSVQDHVQL